MADKSNDKRNAYIYQWIIENFSYCWQKKGEEMKSPHFVVESMEDTKWMLSLYPRGNTNGSYVGFYLNRADDSKGPDCFDLESELSFLNADGTVLKTFGVLKDKFTKGKGWGRHEFQTRKKCFLKREQSTCQEIS
ncbi:TD and POZ domain-containing protein 5 [Caerostris extrusa]|uniref:TD and POZ domain-containing protein 5 n=1 Tax=Caerostris extrusa TaxID=172846 RepID=A0AAV4RMC2_CAEEX|nr:TD and POZ domain-containing protein 5 [Caerostris extrusa]